MNNQEDNTPPQLQQTSTVAAIESNKDVEGKVEGKPAVYVMDTSHLKSSVWQYYKKLKIVDAKGVVTFVAQCKHCQKEKPADSNAIGTTSLSSHLRSCKGGPLYRAPKRPDPTQPSVKIDRTTGEVKRHEFNQKRGEMAVYRWIIKDEQSFRAVEGEGFIELIYELCPTFIMPNRKKVAAGVFNLFLEEKAKIKEVISKCRVSITTDTWTSIQNMNYMVVTAHYLDNDWTLCKKIISFQQITSHKGDDIGMCLEEVLNDWGIDKVFAITVDNASANEGAVDYISNVLRNMNTLLVDGDLLHLRCTCHILNLIVKDGLKELYSSIEGIRNCVKYIHSSPARLTSFRGYCKLMKLGEMSTVPMDVSTGWNSTYKMLIGAMKYKAVFHRMARENGAFKSYFNETVKDGKGKDGEEVSVKRVGPPKDYDWEMASGFVTFLEKFYTLTILFSGTKKITSHKIFYEVSELQISIEKQIYEGDNPRLKDVSQKMKPKFDKYWGNFHEVNKLIFVAHVLDPRYKLQMIELVYTKLGYTPEIVDYICKEVVTCLLTLYHAYKAEEVGDQPVEDHMEIESVNQGNSSGTSGEGLLAELVRARNKQNTMVIRNEVDRYLTETCEDPTDQNFSILNFWQFSHKRYPILSKVARDVFAIPSSTVASEIAFSLGRRIVDPFRASLTPKMVEALVCTSDWIRGVQFDVYREPTELQLELYKECEVVEATATAKGVGVAGEDANA